MARAERRPGLPLWVRIVTMAVACGALAGVCAAVALSMLSIQQKYQSTLVVADMSDDTWGRKAPTTAALMAADETLLRGISVATGRTPGQVADSLTAAQIQDASLFRIIYTDESAEGAQAGIGAVQSALVGGGLSGPLAEGSYYVVREATAPEATGTSPGALTGVAIVIGAAVGALGAIFIHQLRPRARNAPMVSAAVGGRPVAVISNVRQENALVSAIVDLSANGGRSAAMLVDVSRASSLAKKLDAVGVDVERVNPVQSGVPAAVVAADVAAVVVGRGAPLWQVRRWAAQLEESGRPIAVVALWDLPAGAEPQAESTAESTAHALAEPN